MSKGGRQDLEAEVVAELGGAVLYRAALEIDWCHSPDGSESDGRGPQPRRRDLPAESRDAVVLLECLGHPIESDRGGALDYIQRVCQGKDRSVLAACSQLLDRPCECVALILSEAERYQEELPTATVRRWARSYAPTRSGD